MIRAVIAMLCLVALAGCSSEKTAAEAMKTIIENCAVPISMEVRVSNLGPELAVRCDAMNRKGEVVK